MLGYDKCLSGGRGDRWWTSVGFGEDVRLSCGSCLGCWGIEANSRCETGSAGRTGQVQGCSWVRLEIVFWQEPILPEAEVGVRRSEHLGPFELLSQKYHTGLKQQTLLTDLEAGASGIKALAGSVWRGPASWFRDTVFWRCPHMEAERGDRTVSRVFLEGTNPIVRALPA